MSLMCSVILDLSDVMAEDLLPAWANTLMTFGPAIVEPRLISRWDIASLDLFLNGLPALKFTTFRIN